MGYHIRVSSWNGVGAIYGDHMYSTPASLSPGRSPDAPTKVQTSIINSSAVNISWSTPVNQGGLSFPVNKYGVEWDANAGVSEQQEVRISGAASGTFLLSFEGQTTDPLLHDITALDLKAALEALSTIGQVTVHRNVDATHFVWSITFDSNVGNLEQMSLNADNLFGERVTQSVQTRVQGTRPAFDQGTQGIHVSSLGTVTVLSTPEVQTISVSTQADDLAGQFWVSFMGHTSVPIAFDASARDLEVALEGIKAVDDVSVSRRVTKYPYTPVHTSVPLRQHGN